MTVLKDKIQPTAITLEDESKKVNKWFSNYTVSVGINENKLRGYNKKFDEHFEPEVQHQGAIHSVGFLPKADAFLTISEDRTCRTWSSNKGECIACWTSGHAITALAISSAGHIAIGDSQGNVLFFE